MPLSKVSSPKNSAFSSDPEGVVMENFEAKLPEPHFSYPKMNFFPMRPVNLILEFIKIREYAEKLQLVSYFPCDHYQHFQ